MPEPNRPLKVFLCHASADKPKVRELHRYLRRRGIKPWLDEVDLVAGQDWQVEIPKALTTSDAIIICLTKNSVDKEGYIQKEIKFALDKALEMPEGRIFLIPIRFEECDVPFSLSRYQWVDLLDEAGYARMMRALKFRASQLQRTAVELPKTDVDQEKLAREKEEREEAARVEQEKTEQAMHAEAEREAAERAAREKADREAADKIANKKAVQEIRFELPKPEIATPELQKTNKLSKSIAVIILAFVGLFGIIRFVWAASPLLANLFERTPEPTIIASTPADTKTPEPSKTPTKVITPTIALTVTATPFPTQITDSKGVTMRLVPAGKFMMGSTNGSDDEKPVHQVYLDAFYLDVYEVTNAAYKACVEAGECDLPQNTSSFTHSSYYGDPDFNNYPVVYVGWNQADAYCTWRDASLPTEAQWEKAARGTDGRSYPWGNQFDDSLLNFCDKNCAVTYSGVADTNSDDGYADTAPVGSYESGRSPYGIYDLAGNVWEWVADWYDSNYYANSPSSNPLAEPNLGQDRVLRGGSWSFNANTTRSAYRFNLSDPSYVLSSVGIRCAKDATP